VYPEDKPKSFRGLQYLVEHYGFNTIELNNTFYRPPRPSYCEKWLEDVSARSDFRFTAKLWRRFTHEREEPWSQEEVRQYREGVRPLVEANRLGAVLVQFPWSFRYGEGARDWLSGVVGEFGDLPLVVEIRSVGWLEEEAVDFLEGLGVGFCNIDQPGLRGNIPLTDYGFGPTGYLRMHGRNYESWFSDDSDRDERYDYLYSGAELDEIAGAVASMAEKVEEMYVIANNHYRGQAPANALQLMSRLSGQGGEAPAPLAEHYNLEP
jgi:uncharacterized protein YecE (DUF72 family)